MTVKAYTATHHFLSRTLRRQVSHVRLLKESEATVLARVQYPNRTAATLFGENLDGRKKVSLAIGLTSVSQRGTIRALDALLPAQPHSDRRVVVVVFFPDENLSAARERAAKVAEARENYIRAGSLVLVAPRERLYPPPPSNVTLVGGWKDSLGSAFLMAFSAGTAKFYVHTTESLLPQENYVEEIATFASSSNVKRLPWSSLLLSSDDDTSSSRARLYKDSSLSKVVSFILTSYSERSLKDLLHFFDVVQMAER